MIIPHAEPDSACSVCGLPLEGPFIEWRLQRIALKMHANCAHSTSGRIRNNVFRLYRLNQEDTQHAKAANQETPERLFSVSPGA